MTEKKVYARLSEPHRAVYVDQAQVAAIEAGYLWV